MSVRIGYNGTARGRMHVITHEGPKVGTGTVDGHLTAACGQEFDGFVWEVTSWAQRDDRCARCTKIVEPKPVRFTVSVPIEVDDVAWELTYGIAADRDALLADIVAHVTATVREAAVAALAAQGNGATVRP